MIVRKMGLIIHLPKSLVAHLRSSFIVSDLAQAMEELMCNSLDAGAKRIVASVDLASLYIKVEDDGCGINRDDLLLIGERNATSKLSDLVDLETGITTLGFRGEALSSLSEIAILEVISRAQGSPNTYKKIVKGSKKLSMGICSEHRSPGTSVILRDLFHNLPVRRRVIQSSPRKVLQAVKDGTLRLALIHSDVSFRVIDLERQEDLIHTDSCVSPLNTLCKFFGEELCNDLQELTYSKENRRLYGFVSKEASRFPSKAVQFLYLNRRFVHKTPIHKLVNAYAPVNKGFTELCNQSEYTAALGRKNWTLNTSSKRLFPAFLLDLSCPHSSYDITFEAAKTSVEFKDWGSVLSFVKEALDTVWNRSARFQDKGGTEDLSPMDVVLPVKSSSRKRKAWQLTDPTYQPRLKVNLSSTYMRDNVPCVRGFESHSTALDSVTRLQDPYIPTTEELDNNCKKSNNNSSSDLQIYNDLPNCCWDLHHCKCKTANHVTNPRFLRSKTNQVTSLESKFSQQNDDDEDVCGKTNQVKSLESKFSQRNDDDEDVCGMKSIKVISTVNEGKSELNSGLIECRKPNLFVEDALLSQDTLSASLDSFSTGRENWPFYPDSLDLHTLTDTLSLDVQQSKHLFGELIGCHNGPSIDFKRDGIVSVEDEQTPSASWKPSSISRTYVRRRLYDLYLKPGHDFLCHSDRQSVCNLVFRQDLDRPGQLLERYGQSESFLKTRYDWVAGRKKYEENLVSSMLDASAGSSHHEIFEREPDELNEHELSTKGNQSLFHSFDFASSLSEWKDKYMLKSGCRAANFLLQDGAEVNAQEELLRNQHEKQLSTRRRPLCSSKGHLKRSLSAPPFFKPLKRYAQSTESILLFPKTRDVEDRLTAQHENSLTAVEGSLASRTFQETAMLPQDEPQGILQENLSPICVSLEEIGNDSNEARETSHSLPDLDLLESNDRELTTKELYEEWRNPYIKKYEKDVLDLSSGILGPMNKQLLPDSISKEMLQNARVLEQLGKKFIAVVAAGILVVVDQHAADERIRLEQLRKEVLVEGKKQLSTLLDHPQKLIITMGDQQLLHTYKSQIEDWGWRFKVRSLEKTSFGNSSVWSHEQTFKGSSLVQLNAVPQILGENLKDGSDLSEYLHQLAITDGTSAPPPAVLRVLATKACRGAIMFGDFLLRSECQQLIEGLKQTALCFQCAHGRPTLVPLVSLKALHQRLCSLSYERGTSKATCEPVSADHACNLVELSNNSTEDTAVWHGLQWHRPTLKRAEERLKNAQGI